MAERWVGPSSAGGADGTSWADRYGALNDVEDNPVAAGDQVHVGPGVYRELLTVDVSGGNTYAVGTVSLTNGSPTVTGAGTTFVGNVFPTAGYFHVRYAENGADGVVAGDNSFTSAGADFDAGHAGMIIQINAEGAYKIATVTDANTLVLSDPNGLGWPGPADPVTWSIMSGQGHYSIASVDDNTTLTLDEPWQGPTLDGLSYLTFQAIEYIADVTGEVTDGIGGIVRITGSDNDTTAARASCIATSGFDYRVFLGFTLDLTSGTMVDLTSGEHILLEGITLQCSVSFAINITGADQLAHTLRHCIFMHNGSTNLQLNHGADVDDSGHVIENCRLYNTTGDNVIINNIGGNTFKSDFLLGGGDTIDCSGSPTTGQTTVVTGCILVQSSGNALEATTLGDIIEDYNNFWENTALRSNVGIGGNSVAYPPLFHMPILLNGYRFPWQFGALSEWSGLGALTGWAQYAVGDDFFGITRPTTAAKRSSSRSSTAKPSGR